MYKITIESENLTYYQEKLQYVKYQEKNDLMLMCDESEAQGILSQDGSQIYSLNKNYRLKEEYPVCTVTEISFDQFLREYNEQQKAETARLSAIILSQRTI